jgi:hypothetical protein
MGSAEDRREQAVHLMDTGQLNLPARPLKAAFHYQIVALYLDDPDSPAALVAMPIDAEHAEPMPPVDRVHG